MELEKVQKHIDTIRELYESTQAGYIGFINKDDIKSLIGYMEASTVSKRFFANTNAKELLSLYEAEVNTLVENLGAPKFTTKQKLLNFLEYIRLRGMYENLPTADNYYSLDATKISQSGLNIALIGKGVCASQVEFFNDLVVGIDGLAKNIIVRFVNEENMIIGNHAISLIGTEEEGIQYIDPTFYNGTKESLEGSYNKARVPKQVKEESKIFIASDEEIEYARQVVSEYLIDRYKLKEVSAKLELEGLSDLEKQIRILAFLEKYTVPTNVKLNCRSVMLGDCEIEAGKLMELLFRVNNMPCRVICEYEKSDTTYEVELDGENYFLRPSVALICAEKGVISTGLHTKNFDGIDTVWLWQTSPEMRKKYTEAIDSSRKFVRDRDFFEEIPVSQLLVQDTNDDGEEPNL